jgi:tetratricopeptide (TPR) repeat protein
MTFRLSAFAAATALLLAVPMVADAAKDKDKDRAKETDAATVKLLAQMSDAELKMATTPVDEVHAAYLEALKAAPRDQTAMFMEAYTNPVKEEAETFFREALPAAEDKSPYYTALGMIFNDWKINERAAFNLDKALETYPANYLAYYFRGKYYLRRDDLKEAVAQLEKALSMQPGFVLARLLLGTAYQGVNDSDKAISAYEAAVKSEPKLFPAHYNLGLLYEAKGRQEEAVAEYQMAADLAPGNFGVQVKIAGVLEKSGKFKEAAEAYERAAKLKPNDADVCVAVAKLEGKIGDKDREYSAWERAVKANPGNADSQLALAWMALDRGDLDRAERAFLEAARKKQDDHMIYVGLGRVMTKKGEYRKAMEHYRRALRIESASKEAKAELAAIQTQLNISTEKYGGKTPQETYSIFTQKILKIYKQALKKTPGLRGTLTVVITVDSMGAPSDVYLDQSTLKNAELETTIYGNALMAQFPAGKDGTKYKFPLRLSPGAE